LISYYDTRKELGLSGYLEYPQRFYRDEEYYESVWFYNSSLAERKALDIYFAEDITIVHSGQRKTVDLLSADWDDNLEKVLITFDVEDIPIEDQKDALMQETDSQCKQIIYKNWSAESQSNVAMGLYEQPICEQCKLDISQMLINNQANLNAIELLITQEDIDAFEATWSLS